MLSIYEVHMASCAVSVDGHIVAAAHEERFTQIKNDMGIPIQAIQFCLKKACIKIEDIDIVIFVNETFDKNGVANLLFKRMANYSIFDWIRENNEFWYPKIYNDQPIDHYFYVLGGFEKIAQSNSYLVDDLNFDLPEEEFKSKFNEVRVNTLKKFFPKVSASILFAPHWLCHHYHAAYSGGWVPDDQTVVLHAEGDGGEFNSAITVADSGQLRLLAGTNNFNLGRLYQWTTLLLGMKPYSHEYKLMGLAPYAKDDQARDVKELLNEFFYHSDRFGLIETIRKDVLKDFYFAVRNLLEGYRFDAIAGGVQLLVEEMLCKWMATVVYETKRPKIKFGGGVAMNVKANLLISELKEVKDFFIPIAPSDETNVFGALYWADRTVKSNSRDKRTEFLPSLITPYWGKRANAGFQKGFHDMLGDAAGFDVITGNKAAMMTAADALCNGKIVARVIGQSEFGQRALGNRSILALPSAEGIVDKINFSIKQRDFWMPFAPSIIEEDAPDVIELSHHTVCPHMTRC